MSKTTSRPQSPYSKAHGPLPLWKYVVAGGTAGIIEIVSVFPLDTAKVRLQLQQTTTAHIALANGIHAPVIEYRGVFDVLKKIVQNEGYACCDEGGTRVPCS